MCTCDRKREIERETEKDHHGSSVHLSSQRSIWSQRIEALSQVNGWRTQSLCVCVHECVRVCVCRIERQWQIRPTLSLQMNRDTQGRTDGGRDGRMGQERQRMRSDRWRLCVHR